MRVFSFAQESTRYCNYSKNKFDNQITFICPSEFDINELLPLVEQANKDSRILYNNIHNEALSREERAKNNYIYSLSNIEHDYMFQIDSGWSAQEARALLPNSLKTEIVMTGTISQWIEFFKLRTARSAHPDMQLVAGKLEELFKTRGFIL